MRNFPLERLFLFFSLSPAHALARPAQLALSSSLCRASHQVGLLSLEDSTRARDFPFNNFPKLFSLPFRADLRRRTLKRRRSRGRCCRVAPPQPRGASSSSSGRGRRRPRAPRGRTTGRPRCTAAARGPRSGGGSRPGTPPHRRSPPCG